MSIQGSIFVRGEGGQIIEMDLPLPEAIADRLAAGKLHRVTAEGAPLPADPTPQHGELPLVRPAADAPRRDWTGYVMRRHGLTEDEADNLSRQELMSLDALSALRTATGTRSTEIAGHSMQHQQPAATAIPGGSPPPFPELAHQARLGEREPAGTHPWDHAEDDEHGQDDLDDTDPDDVEGQDVEQHQAAPAPADGRPPKAAKKPAWVAWAVSSGRLSEADAQQRTLTQLQQLA